MKSSKEVSLKPFGKRIAFLRKARGWSQEKLALESGMARSYLGGVERGTRNVSLFNIMKLATTMGIPASDFFPPYKPHVGVLQELEEDNENMPPRKVEIP